MYFRVNQDFSASETKDLAITVVARRVEQKKETSISLFYESLRGYRSAQGRFKVQAGKNWSSHTWKVNDANFVGGWGWSFRTDSHDSPGEIAIKEVRVKKM